MGLGEEKNTRLVKEAIGMYSRCPGQDMRNLRVKLYKCPNCGEEVEIFSDEVAVRCHRCKTKVYSDMANSCIEWCASARECLGKERWKQLKGLD